MVIKSKTTKFKDKRRKILSVMEVNSKTIKFKDKKRLKIPKGQSESVYRRRTDNTMAKRRNVKGQGTI